MWWRDAVIYQVYPRSFQDTNGDGIGDLRGITARLDHLVSLGVDALWLSPFYPSPDADFGYDVSDYEDVDPRYGTLADFDALLEAAHARGLRLIVDFVPCHTSIEHAWFREHPEFYVWADEPPNNWRAAFGGPAWERDERTGRYYLHSFYIEQADLDWRRPAVRERMAAALRFWRARGVDGFRLDAIDKLLKDPELRDDPPATEPSILPFEPRYGELAHVHSGNAPDIGMALGAIRDAVDDALLVGEVYLPTAQLAPYLDALDVAFAFEAMNAGPDCRRLKAALARSLALGKLGWVLSNHDFERFASRFGTNARAGALLFLSLPGPVFMFEGDELGLPNGPGADPPLDRAGRDRFRHPMQWDSSPAGGFTTGTPWLASIDPATRNVGAQLADPDSTLSLFRALIALRRDLRGDVQLLESPPDTMVFRRGDHTVAVNFGEQPAAITRDGEVCLRARPGDGARADVLPEHGGWIARHVDS